MYRSRFMSLIVCAAIACMAIVSFAFGVVERTVVATCRAAKALVLDGFKLAAAPADAKRLPLVAFIQAKVFVLRLAKRERPEVSGSWRMCPST